jgi:hypothetical protein
MCSCRIEGFRRDRRENTRRLALIPISCHHQPLSTLFAGLHKIRRNGELGAS